MTFRRGMIVWFYWRGYLSCSPVLKVSPTTVTVAVSDGERRLPKARVSTRGDKAPQPRRRYP